MLLDIASEIGDNDWSQIRKNLGIPENNLTTDYGDCCDAQLRGKALVKWWRSQANDVTITRVMRELDSINPTETKDIRSKYQGIVQKNWILLQLQPRTFLVCI